MNLNQLLYSFKRVGYQFAKLLPRGLRRPVYAILSLIGLFFFYNMMLKLGSPYLLEIHTLIMSLYEPFKNVTVGAIFIVSIIILYAAYRNYNAFKSMIALIYVAIFILGIMHLFVGGYYG